MPADRSKSSLISAVPIEQSILFVRGEKVMLDSDLAALYGVATRALNQAVKRNVSRFPADFMFRLTTEETGELNRSQIVTGSQKHRDPRFPPFAFTEQGVAMLSGVLHSDRAVQVNVEIMRTFVRLRKMLATHEDLSRRLEALEHRYDSQFKMVFDAIRQLMAPPTPAEKKRRIGFVVPADESLLACERPTRHRHSLVRDRRTVRLEWGTKRDAVQFVN